MTTQKVRDERTDSVKYWLIVLVIIGHVFGREEFYNTASCVVIGRWIYLFHMPLFIFISGYFSRKKSKKDLWASIWSLLEPLIFFQALTLTPRLLFKGTDNYLITILTPWYALWYLLSLICWRLILQLVPDRILNNMKLVITCTFCISILAGFLPFNYFLSLQRTLSFMPFFFWGYCMRGKSIYLLDKYKPYCFLFLFLTIAIPLFFPQYVVNLMHADPYSNIYGALHRAFIFGLAIPMSIAFINIVPNIQWAAQQGKLTMQYYIYHALLIPPLMFVVCKTGVPVSLFTATLYSIIIIIGIGMASHLPYFRKLTNISTFVKN